MNCFTSGKKISGKKLRPTATLFRPENIGGGRFNHFRAMPIHQESVLSAYQISKPNKCLTVMSLQTL